MATASRVKAAPRLTVVPRRKPFLLQHFRWMFVPSALIALVGVISLIVSGNLLLPFRQIVTLNGKMGSKADLFKDEEIKRILLKNHREKEFNRDVSSLRAPVV